MKYWIDEESGIRMSEPDCCDEWLSMMWMIGVDYDGCNTVTEFKHLIDELVEMSEKARDCLSDGRLFPEESVTAGDNPAKSIHAQKLPTSKTPGLSELFHS